MDRFTSPHSHACVYTTLASTIRRMPEHGHPDLFDLDASAALTFYAPITVSHFCYRTAGDGFRLERGRDFIIAEYRTGRLRRRVLMLTPSGVSRLIDRRSGATRLTHAETTRAANARTRRNSSPSAAPTA